MDLALTPSRTVAVVGPVAGLETSRATAVLAAAGALPQPHLAVEPRAGERAWRYRTDLAEHVVRRDDLPTDDLGALLTTVRRGADETRPLNALLCGDHLVVDYSHGVGDGQLGVYLLAALCGDVDEERSRILARGLPPRAVGSAAWRHFRARPAAIADVRRLRSENKVTTTGGRPTRTVDDWQAHNRTVTAYMPPATVTATRDWSRANAPGATSASLTVALWMAALRAQGAELDERVMILMNCRRYLDPSHALAQGNFAVAMPVVLPASGDPAEIAALVRRIFDSGWPIAVLLMAEAKARLGRGGTDPGSAPGLADAGGRIRLSISDLGRLPMFDHVEWVPGGRPPQLAAYLEPDGPDAVTLLVSELAGGRTFTATFCDAAVDAGLVEGALKRMCDDPLGTLPSAGH
ncbi:hypothetical protein GCM10023114_22780 [Mycolicibacterium sediminis]|uniref:Condensation domain-containing protein n=1 Tax=Mycolicibacterium sediminis TaxID=1286180 RepID=A0A7I7QKH2_9MYCO|nr:hypothetical protein MSEDJ_05730 [Mycolicibacterium sediminis]